MAEKQITTNELAQMIKKGFDNTATKAQLDGLDKRLNVVEKGLSVVERDVKYIKENIKSAAELEKDVGYIKNTLGIPALGK